MKKIASLMLLLLSPFCARAMDVQPATESKAETPLSPRTLCLRDGSSTPLLEMVKYEITHLPDPAKITEGNELIEEAIKASALKTLQRSLIKDATGVKVENSQWQEAQKLLGDDTKEFFLKKIIQEVKESSKVQ
ncbi:MAG TPA: hypothetical protein VLH77_04385 [Gammaproteobacteria bacterium]|nr:hypothetical protein [Gammaproteobacteria bacterium]